MSPGLIVPSPSSVTGERTTIISDFHPLSINLLPLLFLTIGTLHCSHAQITLHALSAAIPHALLVLHSLLDILPFPKKHVSHELKSSSVKCFDELKSTGGRKRKSGGDEGETAGDGDGAGTGGDEWEPVLFDEEEPEGAVRVRIKVRTILAFPHVSFSI